MNYRTNTIWRIANRVTYYIILVREMLYLAVTDVCIRSCLMGPFYALLYLVQGGTKPLQANIALSSMVVVAFPRDQFPWALKMSIHTIIAKNGTFKLLPNIAGDDELTCPIYAYVTMITSVYTMDRTMPTFLHTQRGHTRPILAAVFGVMIKNVPTEYRDTNTDKPNTRVLSCCIIKQTKYCMTLHTNHCQSPALTHAHRIHNSCIRFREISK